MYNKNKYLLVFLFIVCILSISAISATENTSKEVTTNSKEYSLETVNHHYDDVSHSNENVEFKEKENNNEQSKSETDKTTSENEDPLSFSDLNTTINGDGNSTIYLSHNYTYNNATDSAFTSGIRISRDLTVYGNGVTIDGNKLARIFQVTDSSLNVIFYNINFINGKADRGGAIYEGNAYNCTFTGNTAEYHGGAIYVGNAYNCTFTGNNATDRGGAIAYGNAYNCTFIGNTASEGGAISGSVNAYNCNFSGNNATDRGGAIAYANAYNCTFTGNTAGNNGGAMHDGNAYNCTFTGNIASEGGAMFGGSAILCTFNGDTTEVTSIIPAIINVINYTSPYNVGERLKFNLTVNDTLYNGFNTTIKIYKGGSLVKTVYGLTGEGWIVNLKPGRYTAVLSLTDYPDEQSSNTTINVIKEKTTITAKPISTIYNVGKNLIITLKDQNGKAIKNATLTVNLGSAKKYTTDANGQVKINIATLTPKTYNAKITYAESDIFNASTASVKVTVKKATPKITVKAASFKLKVKTKKYTATFKNNKNQAIKNTKVTLKVGGKTYSVKTNSKGQATFKITNLKKIGSYIAVITFPTNKYYNKVAKKVKITVKR